MRTYKVMLESKSPMIMHWDNIDWSDRMRAWREDPDNKKVSVKGDDRSPPHTWLGSLYHDGSVVALPTDNLMRSLMEAGAAVVVPGGKNGKTFKSQTQSGILPIEAFWPLLAGIGTPIPIAPFHALQGESHFEVHQEAALKAGFYLYVKRAAVGQAKHVRVRPRFDKWSTSGLLTVIDDQITEKVLRDIMRIAGDMKGLCDWRPSSATPGPFGRFKAEIEEM